MVEHTTDLPSTDEVTSRGSSESTKARNLLGNPRLAFALDKLRWPSKAFRKRRPPFDGTAKSAPDETGPIGLSLLHEPPQPRFDLVFVHSLCGGSRKTWSYPSKPGTFWPQDWLPHEDGFNHVRIHSFGYRWNKTSRERSPSAIFYFAQDLLSDLYNSPSLRGGNADTRIILITHGIGGLIAKRAYLLATGNPTYHRIGQRIAAMHFLATPHRGLDSKQLCKLARKQCGSNPRRFVDDLGPYSKILDQINEEFRHVCHNIDMFSFPETVPITVGRRTAFVVEQYLGAANLPKERVHYLNANHLEICKFGNRTDSNYRILKQAILTTLEELSKGRNEPVSSSWAGSSFSQHESLKSSIQDISSLLNINHSLESALLSITEKQHPETCQWLTDDPIFQEWSATSPPIPDQRNLQVLWLKGRPGTGKSVTAGHVIRHFRSINAKVSFYFFNKQDEVGSNASAFIPSLIYQMAQLNPEFRHAVASITTEKTVTRRDHQLLWTDLFMKRRPGLDQLEPQVWVLDGIDDCSKNSIQQLISMISRIGSWFPIRLLITSRPGCQLEQLLSVDQIGMFEMSTGQKGSIRDIELLLRQRCFWEGHDQKYEDLVTDSLTKSNGIFFWAALVAAKIENAHSIEDKQEVLGQIHPEMDEFYLGPLATISASPNAELAKCILEWVICSPKPMHTSELAEAVQLDIGRTLTASPRQLETLTQYLIFVDELSYIHITHHTATDFLTTSTTTPMANYAACNFAHHLLHGNMPLSNIISVQLEKFLTKNVLAWIERFAISGDLSTVRINLRHVNSYLDRQVRHHGCSDSKVMRIRSLVADLSRILSRFHTILLTSPSSIHALIPQLCPQESTIRQVFSKPSQRLRISGPIEETWSERIACQILPKQAAVMACGSRLMAVGFANGEVDIFHTSEMDAFRPAGTLQHGDRVHNLAFNRAIVSFSTSDHQRNKTLLLHSDPDWDSPDEDDIQRDSLTPAERIFLDPEHRLAAVIYRNASMSVWDALLAEKIGDFDRADLKDMKPTPQALDMVFNPIAELELLAVSYKDGEVVTCNPWTLEQTREINLSVLIHALNATSDGRILAGAADDGGIYMFLFETLQSLYVIPRPDDQLRIYDVCFSFDNVRIFDIRGQTCNIWEPYVLLTKEGSDDASSEHHSEELVLPVTTSPPAHVFQWGDAITAMESSFNGSTIFVGRQDGMIDLCDLSTGDTLSRFRMHEPFTEIQSMEWYEQANALLSVDVSGRCIISRFAPLSKGRSKDSKVDTECLFDYRPGEPVSQSMFNPGKNSILLRTQSFTRLVGIDGSTIKEEVDGPECRWTRHSSDSSYFLGIQGDSLQLRSSSSLETISETEPTGEYITAMDVSKTTTDTQELILQHKKSETLNIQSLLGCLKSTLFFLDKGGWVCSIGLKNLNQATHYTRHFFIPLTWRTGPDCMIKIVSKSIVAFGRGEQLVVFHGFLEFEERVAI
ncbi:hypothetical protein B0I35DRAFT_388611 [Stachybotrys elegans]|uniref:GPI inositol-deacylase n=1 Tax=Stachybotrys elegans TaxID=80388 RepID=A0A8K0WV41_9HYPO|nr:hypothetical protein B0I35DRAFT_388611 [Stachybotrys elegans]